MNDWMNEWVWTGVLKFGCVGTRSSTGRCSCFRCVGIAGEIGPPPLLARFSYPRVLFAPWDHPSTLRFPNSTPPLHQQQIHYVPNPTFWGFCLKQFFYLVTLMPKTSKSKSKYKLHAGSPANGQSQMVYLPVFGLKWPGTPVSSTLPSFKHFLPNFEPIRSHTFIVPPHPL